MPGSTNSRGLAERICAKLRANGHQAYLVGGCVRDIMLNKNPADYDVATDAIPSRVEELFPGSLMVGAKFGVVIVQEDSGQVEVATFRSDIGYSDGRHPDQVVYSQNSQEDAKRRDFTINGMMMDSATHEVLDFVGGREDINRKIIRTIGDPKLRFDEDKLRLVRAVRFAARFGYTIEPATFAAIRERAHHINVVSAERLRNELTKLLTEGAARRAFELLDETGLLKVLLPEAERMKGVAQPPEFHPEGDVWIHTRMLLEQLPAGCSQTLAWGVLLHDVGKPPTFMSATSTGDRIRFNGHEEIGARMAEVICARFKFSNEDTAQIVSLVAGHMKFKDVLKMKPSTLKRFVRQEKFDEHLELHRIDCLACHGMLGNWEFLKRFLAETPPEQVSPIRFVTGDDLLSMGFQPGPVFKAILQSVEDSQLEGTLRNREEALQHVRAEYGNKARGTGQN